MTRSSPKVSQIHQLLKIYLRMKGNLIVNFDIEMKISLYQLFSSVGEVLEINIKQT